MSESKYKILSKEKLLSYKESGYLTVGGLLEFIKEHNLPDDAIVVTQRVEDIYYETHNWGIYLKEGEHTRWMKDFNKKIDDGVFEDKDQYPLFTEEMKKKFSDDDIKDAFEQYHPVWCPVLYRDDKDDILFLDLHY